MLTRSTLPRRINRIAALGLAVLMALSATLAGMPASAAPPAPQVLEGSVNWQEPPKIISNGSRIAYPWVATDSNNVSHVIYFTINGEVIYTNNAGGAFNINGKRLDSAGTPSVVPVAAIAVGPGSIVGVAYQTIGRDFQIYYRQSNDGGLNWTPRVRVSESNKAASPDLAFDAAGNAHIVWVDDSCGASLYNVLYRERRASDGKLLGISKPRDKCGTYQNRPQITIANGKPQVIFQHGASKGAEIYYARLESNGWVNQNISLSSGAPSQNSTITSDGGNLLFVAWDEHVGNVNHEILFRASFDGGLNWSNAIDMSNGSGGISTSPNLTWSPTAKRAYLVWNDEQGGSSGKPEVWEREFSPVNLDTTFADQISHYGGRSTWPTVGAGPSRADIVWMDEVVTYFQVYDLGGQIGPTGCDGSLQLEGGVGTTRDTSLTGTITPLNSCAPDQMQVSLDTPVTDATAKVPYNASIPVQNVQPGACDTHTVYVRLFKSGVGGTPFSDSIAIDTTVEASVSATNPHLLGEPIDYTGLPGASNGDPKYTRDDMFFLAINDAGDCTGLASFDVRKSTSGTISGDSYRSDVPLPNVPPLTPGPVSITVDISDTLGNKTTPDPMQLIYDPNPPTLVASQNPTVTAPLSTTNIIVPLSFDNIRVNDTLYGQGEGLPAGRQFWGAWIANSTTNLTPDNPGLKWFPVQVEVPTSTFTLNWDIFTGLPVSQEHAGDFYVYVRFLDGAGNPTLKAIEANKITLTDPFTRPTLYLPGVFK